MHLPKHLTVLDVARSRGIDVRTVHRMIGRGQLDAVKAHSGRTAPWLISPESVAALDTQQESA